MATNANKPDGKEIRGMVESFLHYLDENGHLGNRYQIRTEELKQLFKSYVKEKNIPLSFWKACKSLLYFKIKWTQSEIFLDPRKISLGNRNENEEVKFKKFTVVDQSLTFRSQKTRKQVFEEDLKKMKNSGRFKNTDINNVIKLGALYNKHTDLTNASWNGLRVTVVGYSSVNNIVLKKNVPKEVELKIANKRNNVHTLTKMESPLPLDYVKIPKYKMPLVLQPNTAAKFAINVNFPEYGDYLHIILFTHKSETVLAVRLVFRVLSDTVEELQATGPYVRPTKAAYVEVIERIVPGEPLVHSRTFKCIRKMHQYRIPSDVALLLNSGFKDFTGITEAQKKKQSEIKTLLEVPDKSCPLTASNYPDMLQMLLYMEEHQMLKDIHDYDMNDQVLQKTSSRLLSLQVPGLAENRPSVILGDSVYVKESQDSTEKFEGIVHRVQENSILMAFSKRFFDTVFLPNKKFHVSFSFNRMSLRMEHQAVQIVKNHKLSNMFLEIPVIPDKNIALSNVKWIDRLIDNNRKQKQAVYNILNKSAYPSPYIIFGPPGTGKTATLVEAIKQIYKTQEKSKILVCTPSNNAADVIAKRLLTSITSKNDIFRYMAMSFPYSRIATEVRPYTNYKEQNFYHPSIAELSKYRIIISTLINSGRLYNADIPANHFDYVIIDECGQATETEILIPLAGILPKDGSKELSGQLVLVGDPQQLGPVLHSPLSKQYGFDTSMLERLMKTIPAYQKDNGTYNSMLITKLLYNYRSHKSIIHVPNQLFYEDELKCRGDQQMINVALGWELLPNPKFPVIFDSVIGVDQREQNSPSYFNLQEVDRVLYYLKNLVGTKMHGIKISGKDIGIIAPYRKQVEKITKAVKKEYTTSANEFFIGSVEQIQGQERLIIIISTTRSCAANIPIDHKYHLGFLNNTKRFNVALTRAKALMIVIGNPSILKHDDHWKAFIKYCSDNKATQGSNIDLDADSVEENLIQKMSALRLEDELNPEGTADFSRSQM